MKRTKKSNLVNKKFDDVIAAMPKLLKKLEACSLTPVTNLGKLPEKGIYVFFEKGEPLYVGRSNRQASRIKEHYRATSGNNTAPFAFNIAKKESIKNGIDIKRSRADLENDTTFQQLFVKAKRRISHMSVIVIQIEDPIEQTIFEVYAAQYYKTKEYNDFNTH